MVLVTESSMLTLPPNLFTFDTVHEATSSPTSLKTIHLENPTYFDDGFAGISLSTVNEWSEKPRSRVSPPRSGRGPLFTLPPIPLPPPSSASQSLPITETDGLEIVPSDTEGEGDVFIVDPAPLNFDPSRPLPKTGKRTNPFGRITQFFWKSKSNSKNSVRSSNVSVSSRSRSVSSGISSPPFTPDSSLSIYTNSLDSDSHSSSNSHPSTYSDQGHYPEVHRSRYTATSEDDHELDQFPTSHIYYNQKLSSFRTRNHSLPCSNTKLLVNNGCMSHEPQNQHPSYYNTQNLETFANSRRHSIATEAAGLDSCALTMGQNGQHSYANFASPVPKESYLVPIQTQRTHGSAQNSQNKVYLNELPFAPDDEAEVLSVVEAEVHTPTSSRTYSDMFCSSSASTAIPQSVYSGQSRHGQHVKGQSLIRQRCSSDSSSTIEATPSGSSESGRRAGHVPWSRLRRDFGQVATDCEPYCSFCAANSSQLTSVSRLSKMNVAILSCHDCFFSQRAEGQIKKIFETILGSDRRKLNVTLLSFDVREIGDNSKSLELHRAKVQIVVISHHFLDRLRHEASVQKRVSPVNRVLRPKRVIPILLSGVSNQEVTDGFQQYLLQFSEWKTLELKPSSKLDTEFYGKFTEEIMRIYNLEQREPVPFSIFPKKVTKIQPKVVLFFKNVIEPEDKLHVELRRGKQKEFVQEVVLVNPYSGVIEMPYSLFEEDRSSLIEITVTVNEEKLGSKVLKYDHNSHFWEDEIPISSESIIQSPETSTDSLLSPVVTTVNSNPSLSVEYYDSPRPTKQDYCIPPPARPIVPQKPKKIGLGESTNQNTSQAVPQASTGNSSQYQNDVHPNLPNSVSYCTNFTPEH